MEKEKKVADANWRLGKRTEKGTGINSKGGKGKVVIGVKNRKVKSEIGKKEKRENEKKIK